MAKRIFPGNWITRMSSGHGGSPAVGVLCQPSRVFYQITGYALVGATGATAFPIILPSPDRRPDDKPRADVVGLTVPIGAKVLSLGIRVPDMRKERSRGAAFSGLVGTNTNRLKVADAVASATGLTTTTLATDSSLLPVASGTVAPGAAQANVVTPVVLAAAETLQVFVTDATGTAAGSNLTSTLPGGTPIIVEVNYYLEDDVPDLDEIRIPSISETT